MAAEQSKKRTSTTRPRIFINYRREDAGGHAGWLHRGLSQRFGDDNVFLDVGDIRPGAAFEDVINDAVASCDALVAVIGKRWLADEHGTRRLDQPGDILRSEIRAALERGVLVIPVLVQKAAVPTPADVPADIAPLLARDVLELREETWEHDVDRLADAIRVGTGAPAVAAGGPVTGSEPRRKRRGALVAFALALLVLAGFIGFLTRRKDDSQAAATDTTTAGPGATGGATGSSEASSSSAPGAGSGEAGVAALTDIPPEGNRRPVGIVAGPDGALWFANAGGSIGRMTTDGEFTFFTHPTGLLPLYITVGPDDALWFSNHDSIGRITTDGDITLFEDPDIFVPEWIAFGPDGALWFTNHAQATVGNSIGRMTTDGTVTRFFDPKLDGPRWITPGPDGAMWFTNTGTKTVGRITMAGEVTTFSDPSMINPYGITAGPDDALWFTNGPGVGSIGRITTDGDVSYFPTGVAETENKIYTALSIVTGPDDALWFGNTGAPPICLGRITTKGDLTDYDCQPNVFGIEQITVGPDDAMWFTAGKTIGRFEVP